MQSNPELKRITKPRLNKYIPHEPSPKQSAFLLLDILDVLFGGMAGGGKSDAILMAGLQYVDVPGYNALVLRKTYKDLSLPEAIMARSKEWLMTTDAHWNEIDKIWSFPSGAKLVFGYLDGPNDHFQYQSAAFQFIGIDEATQLRMNQMLYMFSRLRRLEGSTIPLRFRLASNPGGRSHNEIKARYIDESTRGDRIFIPASLDDNKYVDKTEYNKALDQLDPVTRQQLKEGDWDISLEGKIFKRKDFHIIDEVPEEVDITVRYWDIAASIPSPSYPDPDYTVGLKMSYAQASGHFYIEDVVRMRDLPADVQIVMGMTATMDGKEVYIREEQEGGSAGKTVIANRGKFLVGYDYAGNKPTGSKLIRARPFSAQVAMGNVYLVRAPWNASYLEELEIFETEGAHDDQVDGSSGAFEEIMVLRDDNELIPMGWV